MRRWIGWIVFLCLLAGGATISAIRWEAWFGNPPEPIFEGDTINISFKTFADEKVTNSLQVDTLEFLVLGDIHNSLSNEELSVLLHRHPGIDFWAQLGDWMERPYFYYQQLLNQSIIHSGLDTLPIISVPGNHEYLKGIVKKLPESWKQTFPNPHNGPVRFLGSTYYVDFPQLRVIVIDTDGLQLLSDYSQVTFWLNNTFKSASDRFIIVLMHHPIYSTAKGRMNPLIALSFHSGMRKADVVFSGHDHNYARRIMQYKERFWCKEHPTAFISTNASKKSYPNKYNSKNECVFSGQPVYQWVKVTPDSLLVQTHILASGELLDEYNIGAKN